jgi:thiol-disulfide isomerase/thioredoxin
VNAATFDTPLKRILLGGAAGLAAGAAAWLLARFAFKFSVLTPYYVAVFLLGSAGVVALGRLLFGKTLGMIGGLLFGFLLGAFISGESASAGPYAGAQAEIAGPTLDGKTLDVSEYRGKVVLVDFWATWCPPCRAAIPKLKRLYDELHGEGLEIVAVSLDRDRSALQSYVQSHNLPWPQLFLPEQEQRQTNPLARRYNVDSIPRVMLIDRDGRIAAAGVHGEDVERLVRQLLDNGSLSADAASAVPGTAWMLALMGGLIGVLLQSGFGAGAGRS